jgi:hypothetical protein
LTSGRKNAPTPSIRQEKCRNSNYKSASLD